MGCGQAELSQWVNTAVRTSEDGRGTPRFLLVDRAPSRWKVKEGEGLWEKLKVDIKDLQLDGCRWLDGTGEGLGKLICISKHLCGSATDLALQCLFNYSNASRQVPLTGIQIALCCHHRCTFDTYINPTYITETLGFTHQEFEFLCVMSSWGALATKCLDPEGGVAKKRKLDSNAGQKGVQREGDGQLNGLAAANEDEDQECHLEGIDPDDLVCNNGSHSSSSSHFSALDPDARRQVGRMCKGILNEGRLRFLKHKMKFQTAFVTTYISDDVTPENSVLVGYLEE